MIDLHKRRSSYRETSGSRKKKESPGEIKNLSHQEGYHLGVNVHTFNKI